MNAGELRPPVSGRRRMILLRGWIAAWMFVRRLPILERAAWWLSDRLYALALLIRHGSESMSLYRLEDPSPDRILANVLAYNARAAGVPKDPVTATWIAVVRCMDRKLDMARIFGDMKFVDDIGNPYGAVTEREVEALCLAVAKHRVRLICLLSHTECAALAVARSPEGRAWPRTVAAIEETERQIERLLREPTIVEALAADRLALVRATVLTGSDRLTGVLRYRADSGRWEPVAA